MISELKRDIEAALDVLGECGIKAPADFDIMDERDRMIFEFGRDAGWPLCFQC